MANRTAHFSSAVLLAAALVGDAWAQTSPSQPAPAARESNAPSTDAYRVANRTMIQGKTNSPYTGDADFDFVAQMAPHTQVAVDLAKVELQYGTDPELRKVAQGIVYSQQAQLNFMRTWMQTHKPEQTAKP